MRIDDDLHDKIVSKAKETVDKINKYYKMDMKVPPVHYDVTGTTAGLAKSLSMSIHLNPKLLLNNLEDTIDNTVPHEVCHLGVMYKAQQEKRPFPKAHGAEWKLMMRVVGVPARTCHSYDITEIQKLKKEYEYVCLCSKPLVVNQNIHNKIKTGSYLCKKCGQSLKNGQRILKIGFLIDSPNGTTKTRKN